MRKIALFALPLALACQVSFALSQCPSGTGCAQLPDEYARAMHATMLVLAKECAKLDPEKTTAFQAALAQEEASAPMDLSRVEAQPEFPQALEQARTELAKLSVSKLKRECNGLSSMKAEVK